jgi:hypothetical protein
LISVFSGALILPGGVMAADPCSDMQIALDTVAEQYSNLIEDGGKRMMAEAMIAMRATQAMASSEGAGWEAELTEAFATLQSVPAYHNNGKDRFEDVVPPMVISSVNTINELGPGHCEGIVVPDLPDMSN